MSRRIKLLLTTLLPLMVILLCFQQCKTDKTYYETGELQSQWRSNPFSRYSYFTGYYPSGAKSHVSRNMAHGPWLVLDGENIRYFENGKVMMYEYYSSGKPVGRAYSYYDNGTIGYLHIYHNGFKDSIWTYYNEDGTLRETDSFYAGRTLWNSTAGYSLNRYYWNGSLAYTAVIEDGKTIKQEIADQQGYEHFTVKTPYQHFITNCAACHAMSTDVVGPKLAGIMTRKGADWVAKKLDTHKDLAPLTDEEKKGVLKYLSENGR